MRTNSKNIDNIKKKSTFFQNEINNNDDNNKEEKKEEDNHISNGNKFEDNVDNNIQIYLANKINENQFDNINPKKNENDIKSQTNNENIDILSQEIKRLNINNQNEKDFISINNNIQNNNTMNNNTFGPQNLINNSQINQHRNILENLCGIFEVPEVIIGILLGIITSIPELITFFESQKHHKKKENDMLGVIEATNNLLTSNIVNLFIIQALAILIA